MSEALSIQQNNTHMISGILSPVQSPETSTDILVFKWGYAVNGASIQQKMLKVLEEFAIQNPAIHGKNQVFNSPINQRQFELSFYPLNTSDQSLLIVLDDITEAFHKLQMNVLQFALICFFALMAIQPLLLVRRNLLVEKPEKESAVSIQDNATNADLKDLEQTKTTRLQQQVLSQKNDIQLQSEQGLILNNQLDLLKQYIEDISLQLARQMINVSREREMVNNIEGNSQAIIMRLQKDGSITSINSFGEQITGYSSQDLCGKNFIDLYPENAPVALKDLENISALGSLDQLQYQHEALLKRRDGKECIILWLHTRLHSTDEQESSILSTGLDITQKKELERNMSWLVNHDSLTSLFNRRRFEKELELAVNWAEKYRSNGCLLTIDLDNFQDINDSCGHKVGDIILRKVAATLRELTKNIDSTSHTITARLGGDEFAIILRNIDEEGAIILSERIIKSLNAISHLKRQVSFNLSSSIGIATFLIAANNSTELLSNANYARNLAKIDGRNQYHIFQAEHSHLEQTHHRMIWRERIESALKNDRFVLLYQPILSIQENKISHYETLIRMQDESEELVSPASFIHIAEQFGLIQQIDSFIIATAIAKQGALIQQGHDVTLTINLSAKAFDDAELFTKISQAIQLNNANPEHLVFEITETGAVSNIATAEEMMTKIKSLGCQFALDDFGIGFSSFHYLRKLPVDFVKIDGSFVTDLANNSDNEILVRALSKVAIGFNKQTVAEFVDNRQTLDILKQANINYAQGYFIGKPGELIPVQTPDIFTNKDFRSTDNH